MKKAISKAVYNEDGFTLLEVMIALSIVAGAVVTLLAAVNYHLGVAARSKDTVAGVILGREKTEEIRLTGTPKSEDGAFSAPFEAFRWRLEKKDEEFGLTRMELKVAWKGSGVSFVSYSKKR